LSPERASFVERETEYSRKALLDLEALLGKAHYFPKAPYLRNLTLIFPFLKAFGILTIFHFECVEPF